MMLRSWRPLSLAMKGRKPLNSASLAFRAWDITDLRDLGRVTIRKNGRKTAKTIVYRPSKMDGNKIGATNEGLSRALSVDTPADYYPEEALPPRAILEAGASSGALKISPDKALELLLQYQTRQRRASKGWEEKLCKDFDIEPETLHVLSLVLMRLRTGPHAHLARLLLLSASALSYEPATLFLIEDGLRRKNFRAYEKPLRHIKAMANRGDPRGMTLLGRVIATKGDHKEGLKWIQKAVQGPAGLDFETAGESLVHAGQLLLLLEDREGAKAVFRTAALELDEPSAYYHLAEMEEEGSPNQTVYLLKAASSGIVEAAHQLGAIELSKAVKASDGKSPPDYRMAREWFQLGTDGRYRPSVERLAQICRESGELVTEQNLLTMARHLKALEKQAEPPTK